MATPTLAKSPSPHQLLARIVRPFTPPNYPKPQPEFLVFPTSQAEYQLHIVALAGNRTISRHKSPTFALKKCIRLNKQRCEGARNETN